MIYVTSDPHINHKNIIHLCGRPYPSIEDMNEALLHNTNKIVGESDTLYNLGDLAMGPKELIWPWLERIKCKNLHLCIGNHDRKTYLVTENDTRQIFKTIGRRVDLKYKYGARTIPIVMTHFPLERSDLPDDTLFLHGHNHRHSNKIWSRFNMCDVGVDGNNYKPVALDTLVEQYLRNKK